MDSLNYYILTLSKYSLIVFSLIVLGRSLRSMLSEKYDDEIWAYIRYGNENFPLLHWENILGRGRSSDVRIYSPKIARVHAVLCRNDRGVWKIYDVFSKGGVWINDEPAGYLGSVVKNGDKILLADKTLVLTILGENKIENNEGKRSSAGKRIYPVITLICLTLFQGTVLLQHLMFCDESSCLRIILAFSALILLQWFCYAASRLINRSGFEIETIGFYLTTLGLSIVATSEPDDIYKQVLLIFASVFLFIIVGIWLRNLHRASSLRIPFAILSLVLFALNIFTADTVYGARNWISIAGISFQPSEFVKVFYIFAGASTLDRLYMKRNLFMFVAFSGICVISLALMGDFGSALVFFVCFLTISFMRSGSIATMVLAVSGAVMACLLAISSKPYIAERFSTWGHAWEDVYDKGYQQVRTMSASAAGGLFGKGAGSGWLQSIVFADTDMVFGIISEELGYFIAISSVLSICILAFFSIRGVRHSRSSFYSISSCAAVSIFLTQTALNVFGSMDILPFTGVTFPFISKGGSSLISCWMLLAFLKGSDNRKKGSFAVKPAAQYKSFH